jgi:biopolymer transport protein ExbB
MTAPTETLVRYWVSGGPLMPAIALVCFGMWAYYLRTRRGLLVVLDESASVEARLRTMRVAPAAGTGPASFADEGGELGGLVSAALSDLAGGAPPESAFDARTGPWLDRLSRDMVVLAALTATATLLGLLGTVIGMIATFEAVARVGGDTANRVSGGIAQALITTQSGLIVAIPGVFGLARLNRLGDQIRVRLARCRSYAVLLAETADGAARWAERREGTPT